MGTSTTPKYKVQLEGFQDAAWDIKAYGRPTPENLERYVMAFAKSLEAGGANAHISAGVGYVPYPRSAVIALNRRGPVSIVAEWKAGLFQVYEAIPPRKKECVGVCLESAQRGTLCTSAGCKRAAHA